MTVRMKADQGVFYWVPNEESAPGKAPAKKTRARVQSGYEETSTTTRSSSRTRYADLQFDEVQQQKPARRTPPRKKSTPKTKVHVLEDGSAAKERVIVIDKRTSKESPMIESRSRSYRDDYYSDRDSGRYRERDYDDRPAPRRSAPRYDDRYDDRPRYDDVETRTTSRRTTRQVLIEMAEEQGPDTYTYKGVDWVVRRVDGDWDVQRADNVREDDTPVRKGSSKSAPKKGGDSDAPKDSILRKVARYASWGAMAAGVAYFFGGAFGIVTHGASVPIYAPSGLPSNVEQAVPALVGGGVFAALGFIGTKTFKKQS